MSDNTPAETPAEQDLQELSMQELETLEAPGWATSIGVSVGSADAV